ncbi:MAG: ABC transporter ATP-binding protein [Candidatus Heimdallarchaeota archaeon]|nr:ABC transporter ATP-binding protein [Candidatus Heimdallarchaeota archaeon]
MNNLSYFNVGFYYNAGMPILKKISFEVLSSQIVGILGSNGSGKTTLLRLSNGLLKPTSGTIYLNQESIHKFKTSQLANRIHTTFQFSRLHFYCSSVNEEILQSLHFSRNKKENDHDLPSEILSLFSLLELQYRHPYSLSGGEQQRLSLAIAYASNADFFLFDEPTANIDRPSRLFLADFIIKLRNQGKGVLIASHDVEFQLNVCDKILVLNNGIIQFFGTPQEFLTSAEYLKHDFICIPEIYHFLELLEKDKTTSKLIENFFTLSSTSERLFLIEKSLEEIKS